MQRVSIIVCPSQEAKPLELALSKVSLMHEAGRKLFRYEALGNVPTNWQKLKDLKRGISFRGKLDLVYQNGGVDEADDSLHALKHVYAHFRTVKENMASDDIICVIVPPSRGEAPENPNSMSAYKSLAALAPQHIGPKVGNAQIQQTEALRQVHVQAGLWRKPVEHQILFCYQNPPDFMSGRKRMKYLPGGDNVVNLWPVPVLALANMSKTNLDVCKAIWKDAVAAEDSGEEDSSHADVASLGDKVVPFAQELHGNLTQEMIHVWQVQLVVDLTPQGSQSMLAVLKENIRGVAVCRNQAHKEFLMNNLVAEIKTHNLIQATPPAKSPELLAWEAGARQRPSDNTPPPITTGPVLPAVLPSPSMGAVTQPALQPASLAGFGQSCLA